MRAVKPRGCRVHRSEAESLDQKKRADRRRVSLGRAIENQESFGLLICGESGLLRNVIDTRGLHYYVFCAKGRQLASGPAVCDRTAKSRK